MLGLGGFGVVTTGVVLGALREKPSSTKTWTLNPAGTFDGSKGQVKLLLVAVDPAIGLSPTAKG